jgi:UDP-glucuronate 4-epimerase
MKNELQRLDTTKTYLVTGAAGFIGFHLAKRLLAEGCSVIGLDNLNDYYDVELKKARLAILEEDSNFRFVFAHVEDRLAIERLFAENTIHIVIHLAAQAGVRYSLQNPHSYIQSNIVGFLNILEGCRHHDVEHLVYASSSSVYGANEKMPFSTSDNVDHPVSLYAATRSPMSSWLTRTAICITCQQLVSDSSQYTAPGAGLIWLCSYLQRPF